MNISKTNYTTYRFSDDEVAEALMDLLVKMDQIEKDEKFKEFRIMENGTFIRICK